MASVENPDPTLGAIDGASDGAGAFVVRLIGELDISNAGVIGSTLDRMIADADDPVIVDLSGLEFMDSSGIAMLLRAVGGAGSVEVRNPSQVVRRIIECTGLTDILCIEP